jgi:hypothetical protein
MNELDIRTTMVMLIHAVARGEIEQPLRVELVREGTQEWERAWYSVAREYLEMKLAEQQKANVITVH